MFDRDKYWDRRKAGLRGQEGIYLRASQGLIVGPAKIEHEHPGSGIRAILRPHKVHGRGRRRRAEMRRINEIHGRQLADGTN